MTCKVGDIADGSARHFLPYKDVTLYWISDCAPYFRTKICLVISQINRRGIFGFQPGFFCATELIVNECILLSNLDRMFQKQFCVSFPN